MKIEMKDVVAFLESDDPHALMIVEVIGELSLPKNLDSNGDDLRTYDDIRKQAIEEIKQWRWNDGRFTDGT